MKTRRLCLATLALGLAVFSPAPAAEDAKKPEAPPPDQAVKPPAAAAGWDDIKNLTFDQREQFATGLQQLEARVDGQISELEARRAAMKSTTDTKNWDFAMKTLLSARSYLRGMAEESAKALPENWDQAKDRVDRAWVQTQEAYAKVKSSTTG